MPKSLPLLGLVLAMGSYIALADEDGFDVELVSLGDAVGSAFSHTTITSEVNIGVDPAVVVLTEEPRPRSVDSERKKSKYSPFRK